MIFKTGDKVQCTHASGGYNIEPKLGKTYRITGILQNDLTGDEMWIIVEWDGIGEMFFKTRDFALVIPK
jgi:hypothetical protein